MLVACASCSDAMWRRDGDATAVRRRCGGDATGQKQHINRCLKATEKYCKKPAHTPVGMCRYNWNIYMQIVTDTDVSMCRYSVESCRYVQVFLAKYLQIVHI